MELQDPTSRYQLWLSYLIHNPKRVSSATAYLTPEVKARDHLTICTHVQVTRLLLENGRVMGVEYEDHSEASRGETQQVYVNREVILCCGTVDSPKLLMLSGIGPAEHLRQLNIEVQMNLPGVGQNLQDHPIAGLIYAYKEGTSSLPASAGGVEAGLFLITREGEDAPDLQFHFTHRMLGTPGNPQADNFFMFVPTLVKPLSRGSIHLRSANPADAPMIEPNYLTHDADVASLVEGIKKAKQIAQASAFDDLRGLASPPPGETDEEIRTYLLATAQALYHPVGTCMMGPEPSAGAVVDAQLRVHGVDGLRVVDASIMPVITTEVEYFRLPDQIQPGRYDAFGNEDPDGNLFIGMGSGIVHIWGVFQNGLKPGQMGSTSFTNVPGSYPLTGNFSEWMPGPSGYSPHAVMGKQFGDPEGYLPPRPVEIPPGTQPMEIEEGDWDSHVEVYEHGPDAEPTEVEGFESNWRMRNAAGDLWIVSRYDSLFQGQPFEQHGIFGYDPNTELYHGTWVKTVQANLAVFEGNYDEATRTLTLEGDSRSCFGETDEDGKVFIVRERRTIVYEDMNTKIMEVHQRDRQLNRFVLRDRIRATRRPPLVGGNVPHIGEAPFTLVALQRDYGIVKVVGQNTGQAHRPAAGGMVMLGPQWNAVFGNALRL